MGVSGTARKKVFWEVVGYHSVNYAKDNYEIILRGCYFNFFYECEEGGGRIDKDLLTLLIC